MPEYYPSNMYPYGYGMPYQPPTIPNPYHQTNTRLRELEERYGSYYQNGPNQGGSQSSNQQSTPSNTPEQSFITVNSENEAWDFKSPQIWTGEKQWFINSNSEEVYVKWFDANIAETFRITYRKIPKQDVPVGVETPESDISILSGKIDTLTHQINVIKGLIQGASNSSSNLELDAKIPPARRKHKSDNGESNGNGAVKQ